MSNQSQGQLPSITTIIVALVGVVGTIIVAYLQFYVPNQTTATKTQMVTLSVTPLPGATNTPPATFALTFTPSPTGTPTRMTGDWSGTSILKVQNGVILKD